MKYNVNERMLELANEWRKNNPNASEEEQKVAFDKIAAQVVHELMRVV